MGSNFSLLKSSVTEGMTRVLAPSHTALHPSPPPPPPPTFFYVFISILPYGEIRDLKEAINMWHELALPVWGHTAH